jgi:hypothetical protein
LFILLGCLRRLGPLGFLVRDDVTGDGGMNGIRDQVPL